MAEIILALVNVFNSIAALQSDSLLGFGFALFNLIFELVAIIGGLF